MKASHDPNFEPREHTNSGGCIFPLFMFVASISVLIGMFKFASWASDRKREDAAKRRSEERAAIDRINAIRIRLLTPHQQINLDPLTERLKRQLSLHERDEILKHIEGAIELLDDKQYEASLSRLLLVNQTKWGDSLVVMEVGVPLRATILRIQASCESGLKQYSKAAFHFKEAAALQPQSFEDWLGAGDNAALEGDREAAEDAFAHATKLANDNELQRFRIHAAWSWLFLNEPAKTLELAQKGLDTFRTEFRADWSDMFLVQALAYEAFGNRVAALKSYYTLNDTASPNVDLLSEAQRDRWLEFLSKLTIEEKQTPQQIVDAAAAAWKKAGPSDRKEAVRLATLAMDRAAPSAPFYPLFLGSLKEAGGDVDGAKAHFAAVENLSADERVRSFSEIGDLFQNLTPPDFETAFRAVNRGLLINPGNESLLVLKLELLLSSGDHFGLDKLRIELQKQSQNMTNKSKRYLAYLASVRGDKSYAEKWIASSINNQQAGIDDWSNAGWVLLNLGNKSGALDALDKAERLRKNEQEDAQSLQDDVCRLELHGRRTDSVEAFCKLIKLESSFGNPSKLKETEWSSAERAIFEPVQAEAISLQSQRSSTGNPRQGQPVRP